MHVNQIVVQTLYITMEHLLFKVDLWWICNIGCNQRM
jgi:hypothetical protein